jgi:hypothetical protein
MPLFQVSPINLNYEGLTPGLPEYLLGSYNHQVQATVMHVNAVAVASNVVSLTATVVEGKVPIAGALISVAALQTNAGANVTNVVITSVTPTATPGQYVIVYPATASNEATTVDSGTVVIPQPEIGEAVVNGASKAVGVGPVQTDFADNGRSIRFDVTFPVIPTSAVITAQSADRYDDAQFQDLGVVASVTAGVVAGGSATFQAERSRFVRFKMTGVTESGSPPPAGTVVAKVVV